MSEQMFQILSLILVIVASIIGYWAAIKAVKTGSKLTNEQNQEQAKRELFLTLYSYRGLPVHQTFIDSLNKIDIVFYNAPKVLKAWHKYYAELGIKDREDNLKIWETHRVELLSQMAKSLGYGELQQTDISKPYYPESLDEQLASDFELRRDFVTFLRTGIATNSILFDYLKDKVPPREQQTESNTSS